MIFIFIVDGARAVISFCILSAIPGYIVVPPDNTVLAYRSFLISTSHFMMELYVVSWIPQDSIPRKEGWKRASGQRNLSLPMVMTWPLRPSSTLPSLEWNPAVSTRPPTTP